MADISDPSYKKAMAEFIRDNAEKVVDLPYAFDTMSVLFHEQIIKTARKSKEIKK